MNNRMKISQAAKLLECSEQVVRKGLQDGALPFGMAVKTSNQWTYIITRQKFEEVTGIVVGE